MSMRRRPVPREAIEPSAIALLDRARLGRVSTLRRGPVPETPPGSGEPGTSGTCVQPVPGPPGLSRGGLQSGSPGRCCLRRGGATPYGYGVNDGCGYPAGAKNDVVGWEYAARGPASGGGM
ncbi:MAG: hypothetical protein ACRDOI_12905 [Trebonia sp.]